MSPTARLAGIVLAALAVAGPAFALGARTGDEPAVEPGPGFGREPNQTADARTDAWAAIDADLEPGLDPDSPNPCQAGRAACLPAVTAEMEARLAELDCGHNAPFAFTYLQMTRGVEEHVRREGFFDEPAMLAHFDALFAQPYFDAIDSWRAGRREDVPPAWQVAFAAAEDRRVSAAADILLGMNAHISRDLAFLRGPRSGGCRRPRPSPARGAASGTVAAPGRSAGAPPAPTPRDRPRMSAASPTTADRRTFAIISHPDAGKTTLTEKLLLFGGAVREAGAVKSRKSARTAVSDWMAMEKERGISITSTVLAFDAAGRRFNLLDTPGHADFSEDTYRTLWAADAAVMVLDAAKGMEPQTRKLFAVARRRGLPILTFVNKVDRPSLPALGLLDAVASEMGLIPVPLTWPVGDGPDFAGLVDRVRRELVAFDRTVGGSTVGAEHREPLDAGDRDGGRWPSHVLDPALEDVELLDAEHGVPVPGEPVDRDRFLAGELTPVLFGSALQNFGVAALLDALATLAPPPRPQPTADGGLQPVEGDFVGQVFKVQANMDPRHRDRMAFVRVAAGRFERGMSATVARSQRSYQLKYAHQAFADDRETVATALPGDIVGLVNAGDLQVGDTLSVDGKAELAPIPTFAPERFAVARNRDSGKYKQFRAGLRQLDEEGVVHVLRRPELGEQEPVIAGVGQLQFEVAVDRMATEFGAEVVLDPAPWRLARGVTEEAAGRLRRQRGVEVATDRHGRWLALFESAHALRWAAEDHPDVEFAPLGLDAEER